MILKKLSVVTVATGLLINSAFAGAITVPAPTQNQTISAEAILSSSGDLRGEMTRSLQDERVLKELAKMGVDKKEVEQRLAAMSDQELQQVKQGVQRQAGGDSVTVGVTTLLIIIIIILLVR